MNGQFLVMRQTKNAIRLLYNDLIHTENLY
jgi:hypothetical protein